MNILKWSRLLFFRSKSVNHCYYVIFVCIRCRHTSFIYDYISFNEIKTTYVECFVWYFIGLLFPCTLSNLKIPIHTYICLVRDCCKSNQKNCIKESLSTNNNEKKTQQQQQPAIECNFRHWSCVSLYQRLPPFLWYGRFHFFEFGNLIKNETKKHTNKIQLKWHTKHLVVKNMLRKK